MGSWVVCFLGAVVGIAAGTPAVNQQWNVAWLAPSAAVMVAGVAAAVLIARQFPSLRMSAVIGGGICVLGIGVVAAGAASSVVVDGRVWSETSETARVYRWSMQAREDLERIASHDDLLNIDLAEARARHNEYDIAVADLRRLSADYANMTVDDLPSTLFVDVARNIATAAHWGAEAMEVRQSLLLQQDAALQARLATARSTYIERTLGAGPLLVQAAGHYGISVEGGPTGATE